MTSLLGILLIPLGLLMLLRPEAVWKFQDFLSLFVKNGEPTKLYFITLRVSGVLMLAVGVIAALYA